MSVMLIKVVRVPGAVVELGLNEGATVEDALTAASITPSSSEEISVNGHPVVVGHRLNDGDRLILAKSAKSAA